MKVTVFHDADRKRRSPWGVRYRIDRVFRRRFFTSKAAAEQFAAELRKSLKLGGDINHSMEAQRLIAGTGYQLPDVVREGLESMRRRGLTGASLTATFADLCDLVIERAVRKRRRSKTIKGYRSNSATLKKAFGPLLVTSITDQQVQAYLNSRRGHKGCEASPYTRKGLLLMLRMALRMAGVTNPLPTVDPGVPLTRKILHFSVEDVKILFAAARPEERGALALAIFAALRPEMLNELLEDEINVHDQQIHIPMELAKNHRSIILETVPSVGDRYPERPGPPPILWEWLRRYPYKRVNWPNLRKRLKRALGGRWIHDGCRHTGATYYRARYGIPATADLLTHSTTELVMRDYAASIGQATADPFFKLGPSSIEALKDNMVRYQSKVPWPSPTELARLVREKPITHIARDLGCSDVLIKKKCRRLGISTPPRGYWAKVYHSHRQTGEEERLGEPQPSSERKISLKTDTKPTPAV